MSLNRTRTLLLAGAGALSLMAAAAHAQRPIELPQPALPLADPSEVIDNKRLEARLQREEKALRELRQIVLQAKAQGNPVTVKDAGPDPQVEALSAKVSDLEETLRRQTGQMEEVNHNAQVAAKSAADANAALATRIEVLERQLQAAGAAALTGAAERNAPPPPAAEAGPPQAFGEGPGVLGTLRGRGRGQNQDIQADPTQLGDRTGRAAPPSDEAGPGDEQQAYKAARQTLDSGDYVGGAQALQDYLQRYPASPRAAEANYWLGRTLALRNMHAEAAAAYARALRGWPQSSWAGDAVLRLSSSLVELKRGSDACKAVAEFDARYGAKATAATKTRARDIRAKAACA